MKNTKYKIVITFNDDKGNRRTDIQLASNKKDANEAFIWALRDMYWAHKPDADIIAISDREYRELKGIV